LPGKRVIAEVDFRGKEFTCFRPSERGGSL